MSLLLISHADVQRHLSPADCQAVVREAMMALSDGQARQPLRNILDLEHGDALGLMPGSLGPRQAFGAKLISVFPRNFARGLPSHQGLIALFDADSGAPVALVDAHAVTAIRTAAASAVATQALARADSQVLAVLGYGEQAEQHIRSLALVRELREVRIWGRDRARAQALCERMSGTAGLEGLQFRACADVADAVAAADIVCTVTAADEPILHGEQLAAGTHVNLVGSGRAGPAEVDSALVLGSRFFADNRPSVLQQGAEFLRAKAAGLVEDSHVLGEIGEVLAGRIPGRRDAADITVYKSLGSIVQDLAAADFLFRLARCEGFGLRWEL